MSKPGKVRKYRIRQFLCPSPGWIWWVRLIWLGVFVLFVLFLLYDVSRKETESALTAPIKIYSADKDRYATWEREKAVDFGIEQSAAAIKFLFVAAAALLGYLSKTLIEPLISKDRDIDIPRTAIILFRHSAIGCCFSLFYGFVG